MSRCHLDRASGLTQSKSPREAMTAELFRASYFNLVISTQLLLLHRTIPIGENLTAFSYLRYSHCIQIIQAQWINMTC